MTAPTLQSAPFSSSQGATLRKDVIRQQIDALPISKAQRAFLALPERTGIFLAGRGAGKTHILVQRALTTLLLEPGAEGVLIAPSSMHLHDVLLRYVRESPLTRRYCQSYNKTLGEFHFPGASRLRCHSVQSVDETHRLMGRRGLAFAAVDEAGAYSRELFKALHAQLCGIVRPSRAAQERMVEAPLPGLDDDDAMARAYRFVAALSGKSTLRTSGHIWFTGGYAEVGPLHTLAGLRLGPGGTAQFFPPEEVGLVMQVPSASTDDPVDQLMVAHGNTVYPPPALMDHRAVMGSLTHLDTSRERYSVT